MDVVNPKQVLSPLAHPLVGPKAPKPKNSRAPKPKKRRDDALVHDLMKYFREAIGGEPDGYFGNNYDACAELISRCLSHGSDPTTTVRTLIDVALQDEWHRPRTTSWIYLLNNARKIFNSHQQRFAGPKSKVETALREADERFARLQGDQ